MSSPLMSFFLKTYFFRCLSMRSEVNRIWPEIEWVSKKALRQKIVYCWDLAFERSSLRPADLENIPFTLLVPNCPSTFMQHKRCVVHIAKRSAESMQQFLGRALPIDMDVVVSGAILADVGKLLEYDRVDGKLVQSSRGRALRHPFLGVALAMECDIPDAICHIIATHAKEGDLVERSVEATIVHHADFMSFLPFKNIDFPPQ